MSNITYKRTLQDYHNYITPIKTGFYADLVNELKKKTESFNYAERFIALSSDEIKIHEDLVWNQHTGELVGFVDLGDVDLNQAVLSKIDTLATHVLVVMIKSIVNTLSCTFSTVATTGISCAEYFPLFWRAVGILEGTFQLKMVAATADGASPNRWQFFR